MKKTSILYNLSVLLSFGLIVRVLGMVNKIIVNRVLGIEGVTLLSMMMPTVSLLLGIASYSLSTSVLNNVSKNLAKKPYSNRDLIKKSFIFATLLCTIVSLITLIFNYYICHYLLKLDQLQIPLTMFIPMYFFASYGGILKGYYHAHNKMKVYAIAQTIEQVVRIIYSLTLLLIVDYFDVNQLLILVVLSLGVGEASQFFFLLIYSAFYTKLKNKVTITAKYADFVITSTTLTINRLIGSIGYFLEPIVFTFAFSITGLSSDLATTYFGVFYGYVLPLIATCGFITQAISQSILPILYKEKNNHNLIIQTISKSMFLSFIPGLILCYCFYFYSYEALDLIYSQTMGTTYLKMMAIPTLIAFFDGVFTAIIIAYQKEGKMLFITISTSILKLLTMFILVQNPKYNATGLVIASIIASIINTIIGFIITYKSTKYLPKLKSIILSLVLFVFSMMIGTFYKNHLNPILSIIFYSLIILAISLIYYRSSFNDSIEKKLVPSDAK